MAYEMEEIQQSQEIFYLLLKEHEIKEERTFSCLYTK